jgi:hypothetical protein
VPRAPTCAHIDPGEFTLISMNKGFHAPPGFGEPWDPVPLRVSNTAVVTHFPPTGIGATRAPRRGHDDRLAHRRRPRRPRLRAERRRPAGLRHLRGEAGSPVRSGVDGHLGRGCADRSGRVPPSWGTAIGPKEDGREPRPSTGTLSHCGLARP